MLNTAWTFRRRSIFLEFARISGEVEIERGVSPAMRQRLAALGHKLTEVERPLGGGQAIMIDHERGILIGGSDPRKDGAALGY